MDLSRGRIFVLGVLVLSLVGTLLGRLWYVQVLAGPTFRAQAAANQVRAVVEPAPRGEIVDDEGRLLAADATEYVVTLDADTLSRQKDHGAAVLARLAPVLSDTQGAVTVQDLQNKIRSCGAPDPTDKTGQRKIQQPCNTGSPYQPVPVKALDPANVPDLQRALVVEERSELFPGVKISQQQVRKYPLGALAGQELGYLSTINAQQLVAPQYKGYQAADLIGQAGLEQQYDQQLRGTDAVQQLSVDSTGHVTGTLGATQPTAGSTLVTNLDAGLQQAVEKDLEKAISSAEAKGRLATTAAAVVMRVSDGAVLALASAPNYDPNQFTGGISTAAFGQLQDPNASAPLISRAYDAAYPPGSTFKAASAATILQNSLATPGTPVVCGSSFPVGNSVFHNFESEALGTITLTTALAKSCDTFFYPFAYNQWLADGAQRATAAEAAAPAREEFAKMAAAFGYGRGTGIDLPSEATGTLEDRAEFKKVADAEHQQFCAGARAHPDDPARQAADAAQCARPASDYEALQAGDAVQFAIGQGSTVNVTLLQQAVAYAAVANGGTIVTPRVAKAFVAPSGAVTPVATRAAGQLPVSPANLAAIRTGLRAVVTGGTAAGAGFDPQLEVAGKTGTADIASQTNDPYHLFSQPESWFASYQPASAPKYVVVALVEHGGQGADAAAPLVADIYKDMYGLDGHAAVWPGGQPPTTLPTPTTTGGFTPPQAGIIGVTPSAPLPPGRPDPQAVAAAQQALATANAKKKSTG